MKKTLSLLLALTLLAAMMAGCGSSAPAPTPAPSEPAATEPPAPSAEPEVPADPVDVRVVAMKGPTAMGMVQFMDAVEIGDVLCNDYSFSIVASADEVGPLLIQGNVDIAAVPANLASILYNNTEGALQVLAINTLGVLYIVESGDTIHSVEDLRGKTIYAPGKGTTPEFALNYLLTQNGLDPAADVTIEWKAEAAECLAVLTTQENAIAMLPQPFVTTAQTKSDAIRVALDMTEEWNKLQEGKEAPSALLTGVVVARREFVEQNPAAVSDFLDHYRSSVEFVNSNVEAGAQLVGKYEIVTAEIAQKAIPACNITFIEGAEMQEKLAGYLGVLFEQNPKAVGGALPADDFYYSR